MKLTPKPGDLVRYTFLNQGCPEEAVVVFTDTHNPAQVREIIETVTKEESE